MVAEDGDLILRNYPVLYVQVFDTLNNFKVFKYELFYVVVVFSNKIKYNYSSCSIYSLIGK